MFGVGGWTSKSEVVGERQFRALHQASCRLFCAAGAPLDELRVRRGVFGYVPCHSERVLPMVDRLLPVGDSAANRSGQAQVCCTPSKTSMSCCVES